MEKRALSGLKIIEYAHFISGPFCAKLMADLGAEVIKIEEPDIGDEARRKEPFLKNHPHSERSGLFLYLNTNKLGITLNLRSATGKDIFRQLVGQADILVENNPPSEMEGLGLDYEALNRINPRLIMTSISSFGQAGPYRDYKASDLVSFHMGGMGGVTPDSIDNPDQEPPLKGGGRQADFMAGLTAAMITMGAIHGSQSTGMGQHIDISEQEVIASALSRFLAIMSFGEGGRPRGSVATMERPLACKDGYIEFHCVEDNHWKALLKAMGNPEWGKNEIFQDYYSRCSNWKILEPLLLEWTRERTKEQIYHIMQSERVAFSPVNTTRDLLESAHLLSRGYFQDIRHPEAGELRYPGAPYKFSKTPWRADIPAPLLGQHNEEVFCNRLGHSRQELENMKNMGVI